MKIRLYVLLPFIALVALIGYRFVQKRNDLSAQTRQRAARLKAAPPVSFAVARVQDVAQTFEGVGSVEAPLSVRIAAKVTGRVDFLQAHEGDRVETGQVLVRIDPAQVEAEVRQAKAAFAEAQYRLAEARVIRLTRGNPQSTLTRTNGPWGVIRIMRPASWLRAELFPMPASIHRVISSGRRQNSTDLPGLSSPTASSV